MEDDEKKQQATTTSTNNNNSTNQQDEIDVWASLDASVVEQNAYEGRVLRQARHQLAPSLLPSLLSSATDDDGGEINNGGDAGFPNDLPQQLLQQHHHNSHATDLSTLHTVLSRVRRTIKEQEQQDNNRQHADDGNGHLSQEQNLLCMKEQILLQVLSSQHDLGDNVLINLEEERRAEQVRSQRLRLQRTNDDDNNNFSADKNTNSAAAAATVSTTAKTTAANKRIRRRVPMMKRRRVDEEHDGGRDDDTTKRKKPSGEQTSELKRLRQERQKRRQERIRQQRQFYRGSDDSSSSSEEDEFDDGDEKSSCSSSSRKQPPQPQQNPPVEDAAAAAAAAATDDVNTTTTTTAVTCPLCEVDLAVSEFENMDSVLSQHMDLCQQTNNTNRRTTRRSTRRASNTPADSSFPSTTAVTKSSMPAKRNFKKMSAKRKKPVVQNTVSSPPAVDDMEEWEYEDRVDDWIENGLARMKTMKERDDTEAPPGAHEYPGGLLIPAWMNDRLFGYQRDGTKWMWKLHQELAGGIIGDDMGLGKTVQVSSFLGAAAASRKLRAVLIVSPATMLRHWLSELSVWAPGLRRILIHTSGGDVDGFTRSVSSQMLNKLAKWLKEARRNRVNEPIDDDDWDNLPHHSFCGTGYVVVTTYENLRRNTDVYTAHEWSYVVLDEAQKIRNPDADITLACKRIRTPHRLAMSGTPIQNDLPELWSIFDFVFPGRLGTLPTFEQEFAVPIKRGGYSNASPMQVQLAYRCALMLRDLIEPFLLRRLKRDVKEVSRMPGKTEHVLFCRLSQRQRDMYEAFLQSDDVANVLRGSTQLLGAVTMLRKIANHPDLVCSPSEASFASFVRNRGAGIDASGECSDYADEDIDSDETLMNRSGKLEVLSKILPLWHKQGHRVLIFCQWRKMLDIIQRFTMMKGWKFARLDGNTNIASRQRLVDTFNSDESFFGMLCTTRTGGVGLNLTGANRIILYDPDWNPSGDAQARERAWRFGQEKEVTIYRLITAGTIEEKIYQRQIFKTALSNKILQDPKQRRLFSQRDLRDLFTLGADNGSVRSGGDGITDTSRVTRGIGVVDQNVDLSGEAGDADNEDTLRKVMKSNGLAGIFDHHAVEPDHKRKTTTVREMEEQAKRVAKEAADTLRKSIKSEDPYEPTWTGSDETKPTGRFGSSRISSIAVGIQPSGQAASLSAGPMSSANLLATLRQRNTAVESVGKTEVQDGPGQQQYVQLLGRLKKFVRRHRPTTDEILKEFDNVPDSDVAIFRRLLKSVATINEGRWYLKDDD